MLFDSDPTFRQNLEHMHSTLAQLDNLGEAAFEKEAEKYLAEHQNKLQSAKLATLSQRDKEQSMLEELAALRTESTTLLQTILEKEQTLVTARRAAKARALAALSSQQRVVDVFKKHQTPPTATRFGPNPN